MMKIKSYSMIATEIDHITNFPEQIMPTYGISSIFLLKLTGNFKSHFMCFISCPFCDSGNLGYGLQVLAEPALKLCAAHQLRGSSVQALWWGGGCLFE